MPETAIPLSKRYDAVFFDLDDTLTITRRIKFEMHKTIAREQYGRTLTDDDIRQHYNKPLEQSLRQLHGEPGTPTEALLGLLDVYQTRFPHRIQKDALRVIDTLLEHKLMVGIITGSSEFVVRPVLADLRFPVELMVGVFCYNTAQLRKPDPAIFDEARARLRAEHALPEPSILYVGDGMEDFRAAQSAGIDFIGVTTGDVTAEAFCEAGATYTVTGLVDIIPAIQLP